MKNVNMENILNLFSNYLIEARNIDLDYSMNLIMTVNKYISANFSIQTIYMMTMRLEVCKHVKSLALVLTMIFKTYSFKKKAPNGAFFIYYLHNQDIRNGCMENVEYEFYAPQRKHVYENLQDFLCLRLK